MHEMALAEAVVAAALDEATKHGISTIREISVRIGELQRIERDVFEFALREVIPAAEPRLAGAVVRLETQPALLRCRPCGRSFGLGEASGSEGEEQAEAIHFIPELAHTFLRCPACSSPDFEVVQGRGVTLHSIEGD